MYCLKWVCTVSSGSVHSQVGLTCLKWVCSYRKWVCTVSVGSVVAINWPLSVSSVCYVTSGFVTSQVGLYQYLKVYLYSLKIGSVLPHVGLCCTKRVCNDKGGS